MKEEALEKVSESAVSYEPPTQRFEKLENVRPANGGKSVTTGQSLFGGQSSATSQFSINEDISKSQRLSQNLHLRPELEHMQSVLSQDKRATSSKYTLKAKKQAIFEALTSFDINKLKSILQRIELVDSLSLPELMDEDGHNLLHRAAYDNTFRISEYLITYYKQRLAQYLKNIECERHGK